MTKNKLNLAPLKGKSVNPSQTTSKPSVVSKDSSQKKFTLPAKQLIQIHDLMVRTRCLEERLIRMYKQSDGYFWIGGPGEEAFNIPLGLHVKKGQGLDYDFLHLHYRSSGILLAMGAEPLDMIRQMKNTASDPYSGGRNFGNHTSIRKWNVVPITSTIETQYATAIGTGIAQRQHGGDSITIVNGGDAGTAEGEFASCLVWSSRPKEELPILIIVTNNEFGISTPSNTQHGEKHMADRGTAFGIKNRVINGNDPEEAFLAIQEATAYIRKERKPFLLEARVSRLYGHSSATGANLVKGEDDSLTLFETRLEKEGVMTREKMDAVRTKYTEDMLEMAKRVKEEPMPDPSTIYDHTFKGQKGKYL
ncbi:MAG: thiamine pyrophosphate-dependent dehydrogenase E1 component subunit alpha [Cryobacterium sp.]|nr:thiamine pyrophosphate-dependent dehydrogenase E1 component subunit alpha [Oligoflexia bacterium]